MRARRRTSARPGLTIVIVREDLIGQAAEGHAPVIDYKLQAEATRCSTRRPTYAIYIAGLVFKWLQAAGRPAGHEKRNIEKAKLLYDCLDQSALLHATRWRRRTARG